MRSLKVAAIQTGPCSDDSRANLARALRLLRRAKDEHGVDFAVFNELFNIKFFAVREMDRFDHYFEPVPGPTTNALCEAAAQLGTAIVAGVAERSSSGQYYNSAVAPKERATYERHYFSPGDLGLPVFDVDGIRIGMLICYDRHFPEAFRTLSLAGAELIAVPAGARTWSVNWRTGIWDALLRTRAYENGVFVVACNRAGEEDGTRYLGASMIVSPVGGVTLAQATPGQDDCVVFSDIDLDEVRAFRESVPFRRDLRPEIYRTGGIAVPTT